MSVKESVLVYERHGERRVAILDHSRLVVERGYATPPLTEERADRMVARATGQPRGQTRFERLTEAAVAQLSPRARQILQTEILCVIDEEDSPVGEPERVDEGWRQRVTLGRYQPAVKLITLYEMSFERLFPGESDYKMTKNIRHVLLHELGHVGGLQHEQME